MIADVLEPLDIPVLFGFPAGHDKLNMAIFLGRKAKLTVGKKGGILGVFGRV